MIAINREERGKIMERAGKEIRGEKSTYLAMATTLCLVSDPRSSSVGPIGERTYWGEKSRSFKLIDLDQDMRKNVGKWAINHALIETRDGEGTDWTREYFVRINPEKFKAWWEASERRALPPMDSMAFFEVVADEYEDHDLIAVVKS